MPPGRALLLFAFTICIMEYVEHYVSSSGESTTASANSAYEKLVSFNVMSLRQPNRLRDVCRELKGCAVMGLQGTRTAQEHTPIHATFDQYFHVYEFGYGRISNKHAGVALCFCKKRFQQEELHAVGWPDDPILQGRVMAIRARRKYSDVVHICAYLPPCINSLAIHQKLLNWVSKLIRSLPVRCIPIIYMDANSQFGLCKGPSGECAVNSCLQ